MKQLDEGKPYVFPGVLRFIIAIVFFIPAITCYSQEGEKLKFRMQQFHGSMVNRVGDNYRVDHYLDDSLSYGHSNGWIESKKDFLNNLGSRIIYHSITEDSVKVTVKKKIAHVRFVGDYDVTMDGKRNTYHLRVLEVWVKKNKIWRLFARQAIR